MNNSRRCMMYRSSIPPSRREECVIFNQVENKSQVRCTLVSYLTYLLLTTLFADTTFHQCGGDFTSKPLGVVSVETSPPTHVGLPVSMEWLSGRSTNPSAWKLWDTKYSIRILSIIYITDQLIFPGWGWI